MLNYAFQCLNTVVFHIGERNVRSQIATQRFGAKKLDTVEEKRYRQRLVRNFVYELGKTDWQPLRNISAADY